MTREEALKILDTIPTIGEQVDALEMAIKALEQEPIGDLISRQAVLDKTIRVNSIWKSITNSKGKNLEEIVSELPSVNPQEPKTGHWDSRTCKCSECGYQIAFSEYAERKYKYCPNCGADMRGEQE